MIKAYVDGSCRGNGTKDSISGYGFFIEMDGIKIYTESRRFKNNLTNNDAEYIALISAAQSIINLGKVYNINEHDIVFYSDSQLVVNQVNGLWKVKEYKFESYINKFKSILSTLIITPEVKWIKRELNEYANYLAQSITEES